MAEATAWLKSKLQGAMGSEKGLVDSAMKSGSAQVTHLPLICADTGAPLPTSATTDSRSCNRHPRLKAVRMPDRFKPSLARKVPRS